MRADFGNLKSCLYIRTTSAAARLTNRSTSSSSPIIARHSLKKCPDPVSAQPQRGVLTLAMVRRIELPRMPLMQVNPCARQHAIANRAGYRGVIGRPGDCRFGAARRQKTGEQRIDDSLLDQRIDA